MQLRKGIVIGAALSGFALMATMAEAKAYYGYHHGHGVVYANSGEELAAQIVKANSDSDIKTIRCAYYQACNVKGTLPGYTGSQRLKIDGNSSTIDASGITDTDAFASTGGGSLRLMRLKFIGGMTGIYVEVPADQTGTLRVALWRVSVSEAALHGVFINDGNNSAASGSYLTKESD